MNQNGEAISVFTMDGDDDPLTSTDQNIYYTTFSEGSSRGSITQFTNNKSLNKSSWVAGTLSPNFLSD